MGSSIKPIILFRTEYILTEEKFIYSENIYNFKIRLESNCNEKILESYIGVYISVDVSMNKKNI